MDYALFTVTIAMNYVPRDNRARPTRESQLVINSPAGHYQPFNRKRTPPHDALSTNRSKEIVWGTYEYSFLK